MNTPDIQTSLAVLRARMLIRRAESFGGNGMSTAAFTLGQQFKKLTDNPFRYIEHSLKQELINAFERGQGSSQAVQPVLERAS